MGKKKNSEDKFQWTTGTVAVALVALYLSRGLIATVIEGIILLIIYVIGIFAVASGAYFFWTKGDDRWEDYVEGMKNRTDKIIRKILREN